MCCCEWNQYHQPIYNSCTQTFFPRFVHINFDCRRPFVCECFKCHTCRRTNHKFSIQSKLIVESSGSVWRFQPKFNWFCCSVYSLKVIWILCVLEMDYQQDWIKPWNAFIANLSTNCQSLDLATSVAKHTQSHVEFRTQLMPCPYCRNKIVGNRLHQHISRKHSQSLGNDFDGKADQYSNEPNFDYTQWRNNPLWDRPRKTYLQTSNTASQMMPSAWLISTGALFIVSHGFKCTIVLWIKFIFFRRWQSIIGCKSKRG